MGFLYMALFGTLLLWLGFRPRKPKIIFAQRNRTYLRTFFAFLITTVGLPLWLYVVISYPEQLLDFGLYGAFIIIALTLIAILYVLVFSQPGNRIKTRVVGGEDFVRRYTRYKANGEREVTDLDHIPDLVVEGKRYNAVNYGYDYDQRGQPLAILMFDREGKVVRDRALMNKLVRCLHLADTIVRGLGGVEQRTGDYTAVSELVKQLKHGLGVYDELVAPLKADPGSELAENIALVKRGLEIYLEFSQLVLRDWELEAQWEYERGGAYIQEIVYEEMMELAAQLKSIEYLRDHEKEIRRCWLARRHLINPMKDYAGSRKQAAELEGYLGVIDVAHDALSELKNWPQKGPIIKYPAMSAEEERLWRERLEWVERVDAWIAEGYEGLDLERKKLQWQIEQEGLELPEEAKKRLRKKGVLQ